MLPGDEGEGSMRLLPLKAGKWAGEREGQVANFRV
jgi:hypothetical protein